MMKELSVIQIVFISPALWLKMFVVFKICYFIKFNVIGGEGNWLKVGVP